MNVRSASDYIFPISVKLNISKISRVIVGPQPTMTVTQYGWRAQLHIMIMRMIMIMITISIVIMMIILGGPQANTGVIGSNTFI